MPTKTKQNKDQGRQENPADFLDFLNQRFGTMDSDGDGISDEVELMIGTDPHKFDTDGDGMGDGEEIRRGRNPIGPGDFQDFFWPHEGNGYHPHALHPKRALFYVTSAVIIKVFVFMVAASLPLTAWLSPDGLRQQAVEIMRLTNELRAEVGVGALTENQKLTQAAFLKAQDMLVEQYFAHVSPKGLGLSAWLKQAGYKYLSAGENLATGFSTAGEIVQAWQASPSHQANLVDPDFSQIGVSLLDGQYQGEPTIMAVQLFGYPAQAVAVAKAGKVKPVATSANSQQVEQVSVSSTPTVLSVALPTAAPDWRQPAADLNSNQSLVALELAAAGFKEIEVLVDGELALQAKHDGQPIFKGQLQLAEGEHLLLARANNSQGWQNAPARKITIDTKAPIVSKQSSLQVAGSGQRQLVRAEVFLDELASRVTLNLAGQSIALQPDANIGNRWFATLSDLDEQTVSRLASVPATVEVIDAAGNRQQTDLAWQQLPITPVKGAVAQYQMAKSYAGGTSAWLFKLSDLFLKNILMLGALALLLTVIFAWRKLNHRAVWTAAGAMAIIFALLII